MGGQIETLRYFLDHSHFTVGITGAGISVPAGIMAFAGMNFLVVMQMTSVTVLKTSPEHYYKMAHKAFLGPMFENGPTLAHRKLAELGNRGLLHGIITTNIDCLHTLAGSKNVAEIQGSFGVNKCLSCGKHCDDVQIWNQGKCPRCPDCGGLMAVFPVYKHIGLLDNDVEKARTWAAYAEVALIIGAEGSYGQVYCPYLRQGTKIVQINPKRTQFDELAVLNIKATADEVLGAL